MPDALDLVRRQLDYTFLGLLFAMFAITITFTVRLGGARLCVSCVIVVTIILSSRLFCLRTGGFGILLRPRHCMRSARRSSSR